MNFSCFLFIAEAYKSAFSVLHDCQDAMQVVLDHEKQLADLGLLDFESKATLLHLEQTLLKLSASTNLCRGVFYSLSIPLKKGYTVVRLGHLFCVV